MSRSARGTLSIISATTLTLALALAAAIVPAVSANADTVYPSQVPTVAMSGGLHEGTNIVSLIASDGFQTREYRTNYWHYTDDPQITKLERNHWRAVITTSQSGNTPQIETLVTTGNFPGELEMHPVDQAACAAASSEPDVYSEQCDWVVTVPVGMPTFHGYFTTGCYSGNVDVGAERHGSNDLVNDPAWHPAPGPSGCLTARIPVDYAQESGLTAAFTVTRSSTSDPGQYQFVSTGINPTGATLTWDLGDGTTGAGPAITHSYTKPGTFHAALTAHAQSGETERTTHDVVVKAPEFTTTIVFLDDTGTVLPSISPKAGDTFRVRVTASASQNGVGPLHGVTFVDAPLTVTPVGLVDLGTPTPVVPATLDLAPGESRAFTYTVTALKAGIFHLGTSATATDDAGGGVGPSANQLSASIGALQVAIVLDPSSITESETTAGPDPVVVNATITLTNTTDQALTHVNLRSLATTPAKSGQLIHISQFSGPVPDETTGYALPDLAAGAVSAPISATFIVTDDGEIDFASIVTASGGAVTLRALGQARLSVKPKYLLKFTSQVVHPDGRLLPAGQLIEIRGTVTNTSNTATLHVGPLYPTEAGNAGLMGLAYDGAVQSPYDPTPPPALILDPGQQRSFTVQITTAYSDPRTYPDQTGSKVAKTGGTRATLTFTPWAQATLDDGSTQIVRTPDVLSTQDDLTHDVGIDDSIAIPTSNPAVLVGAFSAGTVQGIYNASTGLLWGAVDLAKLPFTSIMATGRFEAEVWASFTPEERANFLSSSTPAAVAILSRNVDLGTQNTADLYKQVNDATLRQLTQMQEAWETGDAASTLQSYTAFGIEQISSVLVPVALARMAKSPAAVAALRSAQNAIQAKMAPLLGELSSLKTVQELAPILAKLASGTELTAEEITKIYGISSAELAELQKIATKYNFLITVRSRNASSIDWITQKLAMLKPETLKIKTVSDLDSRLGYNFADVGSLVFKKPEALSLWEASGTGEEAFAASVRDYVTKQGFTPGSSDYQDAVTRVTERATEWNDYEKTYLQYDKQKWLPTTFNYSGNAADVAGAQNQFPKMNGFNLRKVGENDYVVEMYNWEAGRFVPVTGDIDPIAFTHVDGSPLSPEEHAALLDEMQTNPLLKTQHGESATFVKGGVSFVAKQFKPGEAALQLSPTGAAPRAVRLNIARSRWVTALDYNLIWDGGFVDTGVGLDASGYPAYLPPATPGIGTSAAVHALGTLPLLETTSSSNGPTVGRCSVSYSSTAGKPLLMSGDGTISTMAIPALTTSTDAADTDACFSAGPVIPLVVRPTTQLSGTVSAGTTEIPISTQGGLAPTATVSSDTSAFTVGSQVVIGAGTATPEVRTVTGFGSLILDRPLTRAHDAGELVLVLAAADAAPVAATALPASALAATGTDIVSPITWSLVLLSLGGLMVLGPGLRRRRRPRA